MSYSYKFYIDTCNLLKKSGFYPKTILDIGANLGFTAKIAQDTWPDAYLLLFEANDQCKKYLKKYNCVYKLLGDQNKTVSFYKSKLDLYGSGCSIYKEISDVYDEKNIIVETKQVYRLDDCVDRYFDFIKIDTQGSEYDIILGGINTISRSKVIVVETSVIPTNDGGCSKKQIVDIMTQRMKFDFVDVIEVIFDKNKRILQENLLFIKP